MTTTTASPIAAKPTSRRSQEPAHASTSPEPARVGLDARRAKIQLANLKDELELFGWRAEDTSRYARQALKALPIGQVIDLFRELVAEERSYYTQHAPLADDQLDHTLLS